jgi:hypothetical protein
MAGTIKRTFGPLALTTTLTTNVYNNSSALIYDVIKHIHIINKTGSAATFTLYLGATGANTAGTELWTAVSIAANSAFDWYGNMKMLSTDFLVGGAGTTTALTITGMGEQFVV